MVNFPTSLDSLSNPGSGDYLDTSGVFHDVQHTDLNDAVEALETKVGTTSSAVTTSLDYQVTQLNAKRYAARTFARMNFK